MTCTKNGEVVVEKTLEGGTYNVTPPTNWSQPFYWHKNISYHHVEAEGNNIPADTFNIPRWAKIFHSMKPLTHYSVGASGSGTGLTDYCVAPKGKYSFKTIRMTSLGGDWTEQVLSGDNKTFENTYSGFINETFDCYQDNLGVGHYGVGVGVDGDFIYGSTRQGYRILDDDPHYGNMDSQFTEHYLIEEPSEAGGGAVVITW